MGEATCVVAGGSKCRHPPIDARMLSVHGRTCSPDSGGKTGVVLVAHVSSLQSSQLPCSAVQLIFGEMMCGSTNFAYD